jgi:hypothetical protein
MRKEEEDCMWKGIEEGREEKRSEEEEKRTEERKKYSIRYNMYNI